MSLTRRIAGHTVLYGSTELLVMMGGLLSLRFLTNVLSKEDYGLMSIINLTVLFAVILSSGGLRQSMIRLYGEYRSRGVLAKATGTYLAWIMGLSVVGMIVLLGVFPALAALDVIPARILPAALLACCLVIVRQGFEAFTCIYRAREEVIRVSIFALLTKYLGLALMLGFIVFVAGELVQYYQGIVLGESLVVVVLIGMFFRKERMGSLGFSSGLAREMFRFGIPVMSSVAIHTVFHMSNRYVINGLMHAGSVADYSVAASLAIYASTAIVNGSNAAMMPVIMNAWGSGEHDKARAALTNMVRYYALGAFPVAAGLVGVSRGLITLLTNIKKYESAIPIIPLVVGSAIFWGFQSALLIGLQIGKRTRLMAALAVSMAIVNVVLTCTLIMLFEILGGGGLMGAAVATLISTVCYVVAGHLLARRYCRFPLPWLRMAQYAAAAGLMLAGVTQIVFVDSWLLQLAVRIAAGTVLYVLLVLLLDGSLRKFVRERVVARMRRR